jgi:uncharacterized membrane protein YeaQ/YmgE (transglycosylase-associated protein family)
VNGGLPPLRDRHLAAGFIVVMNLLIGALLAGLLATGLSRSDVGGVVAALVGGVGGAAFGVWRIRRIREDERAVDNAS